MAESNSQATRCPCGFFGSAQTLGLCSKCYNEREQNRAALLAVDASNSSSPEPRRVVDRESTAFQTDSSSSSSSSQRGSSCTTTSELLLCSSSQTMTSSSSSSENTSSSSTATDIDPADRDRTSEQASSEQEVIPASRSVADPDRVSPSTSSTSDATSSTQQPKKRKFDCCVMALFAGAEEEDDTLEEREECEKEPEAKKAATLPVQKNKKRCFTCNCRLALAARELGKCKCECVFCALHRLPEQHLCAYNHKEQGRAEARTRMIVLRKHVGTSLKRIDPDV